MKRKIKRKQINMFINEELYNKSKVVIQNRTKDYEDYLMRRIGTHNRLELLRTEREDLLKRLKSLDKQISEEVEYHTDIERLQLSYDLAVKEAVNVLVNIFNVHGHIGRDNLEAVAMTKDVEVHDLEKGLPDEIQIMPVLNLVEEKG